MVCDPHHHLWAPPDRAPYYAEQLTADTTAGHAVSATVYVECGSGYRIGGREAHRVVGETEFAVEQAAAVAELGGPPLAGIVGSSDLRLGPQLEDILAEHVEKAEGRFRGVRHRAAHDPTRAAMGPDFPQPPPGGMADPAFIDGAARLGHLGLSLDLWAYHIQLDEVVALARAVPDTVLVLNHAGSLIAVGPYAQRLDEERARWESGMTELATCENVVVKIGGFGMPLTGGTPSTGTRPTSDEIVAAWGPLMRSVIDTFGPARCMAESNFPVDRLAFDYVTLWNAFKKMSVGYSPDERDRLLRGTAAEVYRLGLDPSRH